MKLWKYAVYNDKHTAVSELIKLSVEFNWF